MMQAEEINDLIRQRGEFSSVQEARDMATTVLTVLARCSLGGEAHNVAAQLPQEYGELLRDRGQPVEISSAEEFLHRIQQDLDLTEAQAESAGRAVVSSIADAVTSGERSSFANALPSDLSQYTRWS